MMIKPLKIIPAIMAAATLLAMPAVQAQTDARAELLALADQMEPFSLRMLGPPVGTSEWLFVVQPFWSSTVNELSKGKLAVTLNSVTEINAQPADALQIVSQGTFDMTNMVANYGSGVIPTLDGFDLAGVATDVPTIKKVLKSYEPAVQEALAKRYRLDLQGAGMSGAQVFFCKGDMKSVDDLHGKKVRVSSSTMSEIVQGLGAAPVTVAFGELVPALQRGVIDCVITGTMSGNTAKLYEVADTMYTLIVGWAPTVQVISQKSLARLDDKQREWLSKAMDYYYREISDGIQEGNVNQGVWCNTDDDRCTMVGQAGVTRGHMKLLEPSEADLAKVRAAVQSRVLPAYAKACGAECADQWNKTVGEAVNMTVSGH